MSDKRPPHVHHPLLELATVRAKEFLREPEAIFWVFIFPAVLALALGFAFRSKPPDRIPIGVIDGPAAKARVQGLLKSPVLLPRIVTAEEGRDALRRGKISLLVEGEGVPAYRFDATRPEAATAKAEADAALQRLAGRRDVFTATEVKVQEKGSRYIDFLIPGVLAMNLMGTGMWGVGFSIVNARMKKLLKRLVATPMRRTHYMLAQFLSRLIFLVLEVTFLVAFGWIFFGVKVQGSMISLAALCILGAFAFSGLGILVASRVRTIEGVNGLMNFVMMPMWLCSGVFFSYERFPDVAKPLIRALPLTALADALRAVYNDATPLIHLGGPILVLALWGVVSFVVGIRLFRWQ